MELTVAWFCFRQPATRSSTAAQILLSSSSCWTWHIVGRCELVKTAKEVNCIYFGIIKHFPTKIQNELKFDFIGLDRSQWLVLLVLVCLDSC